MKNLRTLVDALVLRDRTARAWSFICFPELENSNSWESKKKKKKKFTKRATNDKEVLLKHSIKVVDLAINTRNKV
jgi:hypothetical protein